MNTTLMIGKSILNNLMKEFYFAPRSLTELRDTLPRILSGLSGELRVFADEKLVGAHA